MHSPGEHPWSERIRHFLRIDKLPPVGRKVTVTVAGGFVLLAGLVMLVTPGPAIVLIPLGLLILGIEFPWAQSAVNKLSGLIRRVRERSKTRKQPGHT